MVGSDVVVNPEDEDLRAQGVHELLVSGQAGDGHDFSFHRASHYTPCNSCEDRLIPRVGYRSLSVS